MDDNDRTAANETMIAIILDLSRDVVLWKRLLMGAFKVLPHWNARQRTSKRHGTTSRHINHGRALKMRGTLTTLLYWTVLILCCP